MTPCSTCDALMPVVEIRTPGRLREIAESLLPYLGDHRIEQVSGDGSAGEVARGEWDDIVSLEFRCAGCGSRYSLTAETWHGQGGAWRRIEGVSPGR